MNAVLRPGCPRRGRRPRIVRGPDQLWLTPSVVFRGAIPGDPAAAGEGGESWA